MYRQLKNSPTLSDSIPKTFHTPLYLYPSRNPYTLIFCNSYIFQPSFFPSSICHSRLPSSYSHQIPFVLQYIIRDRWQFADGDANAINVFVFVFVCDVRKVHGVQLSSSCGVESKRWNDSHPPTCPPSSSLSYSSSLSSPSPPPPYPTPPPFPPYPSPPTPLSPYLSPPPPPPFLLLWHSNGFPQVRVAENKNVLLCPWTLPGPIN